MRLTLSKALLSVLLLSGGLLEEFSSTNIVLVDARKPSRPSSSSRRGPPSSSRSGSSKSRRGSAPTSKRRMELDEEEDDYDDDFANDDFLGMMDEEEDEEEEEVPMKRSKSKPSSKSKSRRHYEEYDDEEEQYDDYEEEDDYYDRRRPPSRSSRGPPPSRRASSSRARPPSRRPSSKRSSRGRVVPYTSHRRPRESTFTRGITALTKNLPDPKTIQSNTLNAISAAREQTSKLSKGIYREVKGLTSSELEQVMLKATKPDDTPVKGKHVERLVGVTYQISGRYDIYDAVLRKLWNKMTEQDWRTKIKALYVLHRFSSDGAPDHQLALKARLRELRRSKDPKKKNVKYFSSKLLLHFEGSHATTDNAPYRAFLARYAHYVLLRVQAFGGMFADITLENESSSSSSKSSSKKQKPITLTGLRQEHLDGAIMLLKAGCAASLKENESSEQTAVAMERVAADMIGLTSAVASTLTKTLKSDMSKVDQALVQKWCVFYKEELLPKTKVLVKRTSSKLDKFGLFLPSRMGASVPSELLEKGLSLGSEDKVEEVEESEPVETESKAESEKVEEKDDSSKDEAVEEEEEEEIEEEEESEEEEVEEEEEEPVKVKQPVNDIDDEYDEYDDEYYDEE